MSDLRTDVCIIGAGIAGITTAYLLAQAGRRVVVLEDGAVGGGETGRTTAHLSNALDDRYHVLERLHGREGARLAAASHGAAIDTIEAIVRQEGISCDFERLDGYLFLSPGDSSSILDAELEAAHRAGLTGVERLGGVSVANWDTGPCQRFPRQGQFHPLSYLNALVDAIRRMGGEVFGKTHCRHADQGPDPRSSQRVGALVRSQPLPLPPPRDSGQPLHRRKIRKTFQGFSLGVRS